MPEASDYRAIETLTNGSKIEIRALRPEDRAGILDAIRRTSDESLYKRFFSFKRTFSDQEIDLYVNVDFSNQVALVAAAMENGQSVIFGGARYILLGPGKAEIAFVVDDAHQGQGIGTLLMKHIGILARQAGLRELIAEVLPSNSGMLNVFRKSGLRMTSSQGPDSIHVVLAVS
jgi:GNAT superfamily N-acetyltransferase